MSSKISISWFSHQLRSLPPEFQAFPTSTTDPVAAELNMGFAKPVTYPDLYEAGVIEIQEGLDAGHFTSVDLVKAYFARIDEVNLKGPALRAVIETNPSALSQAEALDNERRQTGKRSLLHGIPVLLKDNVATVFSEGMQTTAGSYALLGSVVPDDAGIVKRLREAGAIMLGKANMSEFANFRMSNSSSGWSGRGGQGTNAYFRNATPWGSSSGSGVAASIGLATVTIGTETDGSIISPSSVNNIVGIKPTLGLTSRAGVIPLSEHQDSVGPMTRSVTDAAIVLGIIAGPDPKDSYTLAQPSVVPDYMKSLKKDAFVGKRIGVPRQVFLDLPESENVEAPIHAAFIEALATIKELGATIVDPTDLPDAHIVTTLRDNEFLVMQTDFKIQLNAWLEQLVESPTGVRSLADVIAFNEAHPELEMPALLDRQDILTDSEATPGRDAKFEEILASNQAFGKGIDTTLKAHNLDALVLPSRGYTTRPPALAGYPIISVPLGFFPEDTESKPQGPTTVFPAPGIPFGISFFGTAWSEPDLIGFAYAFEQRTKARMGRMAMKEAIPKTQLQDIVGK